MKRKIAALLVAAMTIALVGCGGKSSSSTSTDDKKEEQKTEEKAEAKYTPEVKDVKVSYFSFCGELYQFVAADKGYLKDEGLDVEEVVIDSGADAFSALGAGTTDVLLTYSTVTPLNFIANGGEYTIFAGYMAQGATPLFTLKDTKYDGLEDLVGKKIGIGKNGGGTECLALKDKLTKAGYDINKDFEWVEFTNSMEAIEGVKNGELDFAFNQTGYETVREQYGMKDVWYPDDDYPMYSCCRVVARTQWLKDNPNTAKALLRAYMRAGVFFDDDDYVVNLMMDKLDQDKEKVEGYMLNPHYKIHLDPLKNSVLRDWEWALDFGVIENKNNINIEDHINTELYKDVLDDLIDENPDDSYYKDLSKMYDEYNL